jgi:hypothetical protein
MPDEPAELNKEEEIAKDDDNWENRILCSDESCIGVIGPDGRCKECGKPGKESSAGEINTAQSKSVLKEDLDERPAQQEDLDEQPVLQFDDDWENRTLCSDESCIGVIGPDGRCKECGKAYKG